MNTSALQNIVQCRTCRKLLPEDEAISVESVLEEYLHQGKSIADLIFELSDIMLTVDQQLPQSICGGCVKDLRLACDFRQRCIDSNEAFLSEVGASSSSPGVGETPTSSNDPDMLILKMEPSDTELLEVQKEVTEGHEFTAEPTRRSGEKRRKIALSNIAVLCIKFVKERFVCNIDATSGCVYSQKTLDVNNFIRHFRTKHTDKALRIGLVVGVPAVEKVQDDQHCPEPSGSDVRKVPDIVRNLIKKVSANIYRCVIDERSRCSYLQMGHYLHSFVRHFRTAHPKAAASYKLFGADEVIEEKPESPPPPAPSPEVPLNSADSALLKKVLASGVRSKHRQVLQQYVKPRFGKYWCTIDPKSRCRYAQTRYDMNNFLRHFRTLHPLEAFANDIMPKLEEKKRIVKRTLVCADNVLVLQACINMMALDGLPAQCFRWAGLHSLLEPFTGALDLDINETSILEHIHKAVERLHYVVRLEMSTTLVSVHIEPFVREGIHFLVVSANYDVNCKVMTRVLGLIRATEATPTGELKTRLLELFGRYEISEDRIVVIVLGNVASILGTPKKLQKLYTDSYTEPKFRYGDPAKEQTLMDALAKELEGQFDVVRNVISIILSAMNEIVPNTDLTFGCIERFLQNLRSPQYESFFAEKQVSFPPLWRSQRWLCKFKSIRSLVKQEQLFVRLSAQHPELALAEADWQFMRDYHSAFLPLYKLIKELERTQSHGVFTNFYMKCLMAVKEVRAAGCPFSKPLSELLTKRLMALRQQKVFQAMLFMDPRFQYFKSVVLTLVQQDDAQNYILNIWNRINALKPNAQPSQFDEEPVKQEAQKDDDMDDFLSEMFGDPAEGSSKAVVPLNSAMTPVLQQLKGLEIEPRQPHDYDVWNHWLQRSMSHTELFSVAMVVMSLPTNSICLERSYAALVLADRTDGLSEQTLDELLLIRLNRSLFEKAVVNMYDWKNLSNSQPAE
nr:uncharacterized protein LOC115256902 [Aedes albopictus]